MSDSNTPCILVAEDDPILRYATVNVLSRAGYRVLEAPDGIAALRITEQNTGELKMLITNVGMPLMTGHELARQVKKLCPNIIILIVSGQHEKGFPPGAQAHADALLKPVEPEALLRKVRELMGTP